MANQAVWLTTGRKEEEKMRWSVAVPGLKEGEAFFFIFLLIDFGGFRTGFNWATEYTKIIEPIYEAQYPFLASRKVK